MFPVISNFSVRSATTNNFCKLFHWFIWIFFTITYSTKHLNKSRFHEFVQFVELAAAFACQVADFVQNRRDFALFVNRRK